MKKKLNKVYRALLMRIRVLPIFVLIVVMALMSYWLGTINSEFSALYSSINEESDLYDFVKSALNLVGCWMVVRTMNLLCSKITNHVVLDKNFMKWIIKLTYSKISSITKLGTGAINNSIHTIAQCDKQMAVLVVQLLPCISPFIMICYKEFKCSGFIPIIANFVSIGLYVYMSYKTNTLKCNKICTKIGNEMHSVTTDCISNSKTVKYFNKEKWSIARQANKQKEIFVDFLNLKKPIYGNTCNLFTFIPSIVCAIFCWDDKSVVLFVMMSEYVVANIAGCIDSAMELYTEKKRQLDFLGGLDGDENIITVKTPLENELIISDVTFKYSDKANVTFRIDNVVIKKGRRYCVTGKSGFGKSTFIKLITKTVEPTIGHIDSVDCIYMFAESEMFNISVMENISLGDDTVTVSEVKDILNNLEVNLDIDIENEPVGENGENLSTGQKQRINLARVIVYARRHPNALIALDEVTAALDELTSVVCINYIAEEFKKLGTTLIYVSNKSDYKDTDLITDNIYVTRNGNVVTYSQE